MKSFKDCLAVWRLIFFSNSHIVSDSFIHLIYHRGSALAGYFPSAGLKTRFSAFWEFEWNLWICEFTNVENVYCTILPFRRCVEFFIHISWLRLGVVLPRPVKRRATVWMARVWIPARVRFRFPFRGTTKFSKNCLAVWRLFCFSNSHIVSDSFLYLIYHRGDVVATWFPACRLVSNEYWRQFCEGWEAGAWSWPLTSI
jgi:hypothetical protein